MTKQDYYEILRISKDATKEEIKKAYRKLALKYHPDKNKEKDAEERFKEITEAYAVLYDEEKRAMYDRYGHSGIDQRYTTEDIFKGTDFSDIFRGMGFDFSDVFDQFFGRQTGFGQRARPTRGADLRYDVAISLDDAYHGADLEINLPRSEPCETCKGNGAKPGTTPKRCPQCQGTGQLQRTQRTAFGMFSQVSTCPKCRGQRTTIEELCPSCKGKGLVQRTRMIDLNIPKGVDEGSQLRLTGEGEAGGRHPGDLYVVIHIKDHPRLIRRGRDLFQTKEITFPNAALGTTLTVETLDGTETIKIPEGTQTGDRIKINKKGMPDIQGHGRGDMYIQVIVKTPRNLSRKARQLLEELQQEL